MGLLEAFGIKALTPESWWQLGRALGLSPCVAVRPFDMQACYRRLSRSRAALGLGALPSFQHQLCGEHRGTAVTVVQYETGSGSSTTAWTAAIARIDPPLWLGLEVRRESFVDELFGGRDIQLGDPAVDAKLRVSSFAPARTATFLSAADGEVRGALHYMQALTSSHSLNVSDSSVQVTRMGVITDPGEVGRMLEAAVSLATWLSARRARVPPAQGAIVDLAMWERFAASQGFQFDPWRIVARGSGATAGIEIALETEGQRAFVALIVRYPRPAPVAFQAVRTSAPPFLQGLFSQDIQVGNHAFDDVYKVTGADPASVRALLGRPALLSALTDAAWLSKDVQVGQLGMDMRVERGMPSREDLDRLVSMATIVTSELSAGVPTQGPYR